MQGTPQPKTLPSRKRAASWSLGRRNARPGNTGVVAGSRYYSPGLGRWASRDPIGEKNCVALYAFVLNDGIARIDLLGLDWVEVVDIGAGQVELVLHAGDMAQADLSAARAAINSNLGSIRNAILAATSGASCVPGNLGLLPNDLPGKLAGLTMGAPKILSAADAVGITPDVMNVYSAMSWFGGGQEAKYQQLVAKLAFFQAHCQNAAACQDLCDAGYQYISSVPDFTAATWLTQSVAAFFLKHCYENCPCGGG
jgi:RHS repeat-associated protein